jgi:hypothetical protein
MWAVAAAEAVVSTRPATAAAIISSSSVIASSADFNLSHFFLGDAIFLSPLCNITL